MVKVIGLFSLFNDDIQKLGKGRLFIVPNLGAANAGFDPIFNQSFLPVMLFIEDQNADKKFSE